MANLDTRPEGLNVRFRPGSVVTLNLNGPSGWLATRDFTATLDGQNLAVTESGDTLVIVVSAGITSGLTGKGREYLLVIHQTGGNDALIGVWHASYGAASSITSTATIQLGILNVAVVILGSGIGGGGGQVDSVVAGTGISVDSTDPANPIVTNTSSGAVSSVNTRTGAVTGLAEDNTVVHNTGNETVAGIKTLTSQPIVPDATTATAALNRQTGDARYDATGAAATAQAFAIQRANHTGTQAESTVTNLVSDLAAKAADSSVVHVTGAETVAGVKNFTSSPLVPGASLAADQAAGTASPRTLGTGATQAAAGNDSRLSDARTPAAHHTTHESGGTDQVTLAESQITNLVSDLAAKAPLASPALTGTPTAPTAAQGTSTTQLATTAMVQSEVTLLAPKASPALTGNPTAPTQTAGTNSTRLATTAYADALVADAINDSITGIAPSQNAVFDALALKAPLASPALTGVPTAPTAAQGTSTTQLATTAMVQSEVSVLNAAISSAIAGLDDLDICNFATSAALPSCTYANGTAGVGATLTASASGVLTIDTTGVPVSGSSILVQNQASSFQNGVYTLTTVGTALVAFVLTRRSDFDQAAEMSVPKMVPVNAQGLTAGTSNDNKTFLSITSSPFTVGTTGITFGLIGSTYTADNATLQLSGTTFSEKDGGTTNAKLATMAANTFKANNTGSTAAPADITTAQAKTLLAIANTDVSGLGTLSTQSGTFSGTSSGTNTGDQTITLTGNVTGTGTGSFVTAIAPHVVTAAMQTQMAAHTMRGNNTGSTADVIDLTLAQVKTELNLTGTNSGDQTITLTGDVTGSGTGSFAATLKNTGPGATGPIGSTTVAPVITIDAQGRVTALTSATIASSADRLGLTPTALKTANYTAVAGDFVPCDTSGGAFAVTFPTAPADGTVVAIKLVTAGNTLTLTLGGSDVFNKAGGVTSGSLTLAAQGILCQYKSSGAIWYVIADDLPLSLLAQLASPALTGTPTAPTAAQGTNTTQIATTAMVQSEVTLLAPKASPTFTGLPAGPSYAASGLTGSVQASRYVGATTSGAPTTGAHLLGDWIIGQDGSVFVCTAAGTPGTWVQSGATVYAPLASPALTGTPTAPTAAQGTNTTQLATTAMVHSEAVLLAPLASPTFTGLPLSPQWKATGVTGAAGSVTISGSNASGAPTTGAHVKGEVAGDDTGKLWYCTVAGTPGTWVNVSSSAGMATDTLWNAAGDLAYASADNTGAILAYGADSKMLVGVGGLPAWRDRLGVGTPQTSKQSLTASTRTVITGTSYQIPTGTLVAGVSMFRFEVMVDKTAAGTATWTAIVAFGTANTNADTAIATFTSGTNTAQANSAILVIYVPILTTGAAATAGCMAAMGQVGGGNTTGLGGFNGAPGATNTFDTTATNPWIHVDITPGASAVMTGFGYAQVMR